MSSICAACVLLTDNEWTTQATVMISASNKINTKDVVSLEKV